MISAKISESFNFSLSFIFKGLLDFVSAKTLFSSIFLSINISTLPPVDFVASNLALNTLVSLITKRSPLLKESNISENFLSWRGSDNTNNLLELLSFVGCLAISSSGSSKL